MKDDGFLHVRVPDMKELMEVVVQKQLDIDDFLYQSPAGPIIVRDVIYGLGSQIESSGDEFFAHKTGFTEKSLIKILQETGYGMIYSGSGNLESYAFAFKRQPPQYAVDLLKLPAANP